jgi:hypothetical protein
MPDYYDEMTTGGINDRHQIIGLGAYWRDTRMEYTAGNLIYKGSSVHHNNSAGNTDWEIWKYTWDGDDLVRVEGPLPGSWTGKASLSWAA